MTYLDLVGWILQHPDCLNQTVTIEKNLEFQGVLYAELTKHPDVLDAGHLVLCVKDTPDE